MPKSKAKPSKDVLQVVLSDMHSGSNYALFLPDKWEGLKGNNHTPTHAQQKIRAQWELYAEEVRIARQGKKVRLVHNGDSIDGDHHTSGDVCTLNSLEQARIHVDLMSEFQKRIDWQRGDEIYYTRGTQTHVNEFENFIGEEMNAMPCGDFFVHDFLQLETNGMISWFVHHGKSAGEGANEGNAFKNWMRNIQVDAMKDGRRPPDIIFTGHVHVPTYSAHSYRSV